MKNKAGLKLSAVVASMVSIENSQLFNIFCGVGETSLQFNCAVSHDSDGMCMTLKATNENLPPNVIRQLAKELKNLDESPPEGINVIVNDDDFTTIFADIEGPGNILSRSVYSGQYFWALLYKFTCICCYTDHAFYLL